MNETQRIESVQTREQALHQQVNVCLGVLATLRPFLVKDEYDDDVLPRHLEGGHRSAATATFVHACDRLDKLLNEGDNWGLKAHEQVYKSIHEAQTAAYNHYTNAVRPSQKFLPEFAQTEKGTYIAYSGDPRITGGLLVGHGRTPSDALLDYDAAFTRPPEQQVRLNAAARAKLMGEPNVAAPEPVDNRSALRKFFSRLFRRS